LGVRDFTIVEIAKMLFGKISAFLDDPQWRSKALRGPGSTVIWGPSIPSAVKFFGHGLWGPQDLRAPVH